MSTCAWGARRVPGGIERGGRRRRADRIGAVVALGLALTVALPGAALAAPGDLDPTVGGGDGMVTTDLGSSEAAADTVVQPDGKIVAVGGDVSDFVGNFAAVRYNADGSLDTTFGDGGRVSTDIAGGSDAADGVALQADGKIVVVGVSENLEGGVAWFTVVRYHPDGSLDTTFDGDGKAVTDFGGGGADQGSDVVVQADGKIVAVGGSSPGVFSLTRYNTHGTLDTGFDGDGKVTTNLGGPQGGSSAYDVVQQADGKLVAVGGGNGDFALARYLTNGSLDTGFGGGDGTVATNLGGADLARSVALLPDGRLVAAGGGGAGEDFALARYEGGGSTPPTPPSADLAVTVSGPGTVSIGDQATYTVTVRNTSATTPATAVTLADTLTGAGGTVLSAAPGQGSCTTTATSASCTLGNFGNDRLNTVDAVAGNDTANGGLGTDTCTTDPGDARLSCP
ncbi:hypothetical protein AB0D54_18005 [Streptomyces xanthophaeus]|uniref:hypothetical protein n=1 Tax=Streptomyces xanthophaeus TaxID=67385 RepID=UPI00341F4154